MHNDSSSTTDVYWREQSEADVPEENDWLAASELAHLSRLRFAKRRTDWRLGRWTAKRALAICLKMPGDSQALAGIEIHPAPSGAPEVIIEDKPADITISLSHRAGIAACAVAMSGVAMGFDLELAEPHSKAFVADYFTNEEQALIAQAPAADRAWLPALLWSGKESVLKALREGLRLDTRSVTVTCPTLIAPDSGATVSRFADAPQAQDQDAKNTWHPLLASCTSGQTFRGWWQYTGNLLRTMVATPPPAPPILLHSGLTM